MGEIRYRIIFKGDLAYGFHREETRENLKRLCKYSDATLDRIFSGKPVTLKDKLPFELAQKYKATLDETGAVCLIEEMQACAAPVTPRQATKPDSFECPKCGARQDAGLTCSHCGIVFAKYRRMQELQTTRQRSEPAFSPGGTFGATPSAGLMTRLSAHFVKHPEQAFILKAFLVIGIIISVAKYLSGFLILLIALFPVLFLIYVRCVAASTDRPPTEVLAQHITFMPVMYAEGERKKDGNAWVTYSIILVNVVIFYGFELQVDPEIIFKHLIFIPYEPNILNVPLSLVTSMFLHADGGHLWGNMLFLWAVGTVVEKRIGWRRFLTFYFLAGIAAALLSALVDFAFFQRATHGLGASGAIAGAMGLFAIRCYFKSMVFPLPILGIFSLILPISLKVRLNSLVIIGLFFLADLSGGLGQIAGKEASNIGHWAHIGGMVCGIILGMMFNLGEEAVEERHQEIGSQALSKGGDLFQAEDSLRLALRKNPNNGETMILLARLLSKFRPTSEGDNLYRKAMDILSRTRPKDAADAFKEYYRIYLKAADPETMLRLATCYHQLKDYEWANRCLEILSDDPATPPVIREKAMFRCARQKEVVGDRTLAAHYYRLFAETFPESPVHAKAVARLDAG